MTEVPQHLNDVDEWVIREKADAKQARYTK